jgi:hypothetical protein
MLIFADAVYLDYLCHLYYPFIAGNLRPENYIGHYFGLLE